MTPLNTRIAFGGADDLYSECFSIALFETFKEFRSSCKSFTVEMRPRGPEGTFVECVNWFMQEGTDWALAAKSEEVHSLYVSGIHVPFEVPGKEVCRLGFTVAIAFSGTRLIGHDFRPCSEVSYPFQSSVDNLAELTKQLWPLATPSPEEAPLSALMVELSHRSVERARERFAIASRLETGADRGTS